MSDAVEVTATDEDGANGIDKITHGVDVGGGVGQRWHRTCWSKETREQQHTDNEEPHDGQLLTGALTDLTN